ncbi:uncharacterized protein LOC111620682 isoform X1 [Centruroides sculpturatus]|uniref:uncharacterized protein LOC111620682 isoform X1 n=1 Tax=Centruroides sculpturatus TaxID=218467 RepID=UPI000C6D1748|nr:uncharacterized protein LOC111620682 isoform X1 [Centruroides sculpturatus]
MAHYQDHTFFEERISAENLLLEWDLVRIFPFNKSCFNQHYKRNIIKKLMHLSGLLNCLLVLDNNHFKYGDNFYSQTEGIPMGTCIGPRLAEIFMIDIDKKITDIKGIIFYNRYVDDCIILFDSRKTNEEKILKQANSIETNIQFEAETECNNSLNYLDITINRTDNKLEFRKFIKPMQIPKVLNYKTNVPQAMKFNIFKMYIEKIKNRTSKLENQEMEIEHVIKMFLLNSYPKKILEKWLNWTNNNDNKNKKFKKDKKCVKMMYVPKLFERVKNVLNEKVNLIPEKNNLFKRYLYNRVDKKLDLMEEKEIVYSFNCSCDPVKTYIGETKRKLGTRIKEHIRAIRGNYANSAVAEHCNSYGCQINKDTIKIKKKESNNYKRQLYEHLNIKKERNKINNNLGRIIHQSWSTILDDVYKKA